MAGDDLVVRFGLGDLGQVLGREALCRLDLDGDHNVHLQAIVENGFFQEIVVRVAPQIEAVGAALARSIPAQGMGREQSPITALPGSDPRLRRIVPRHI